jgi:hypothetical protein
VVVTSDDGSSRAPGPDMLHGCRSGIMARDSASWMHTSLPTHIVVPQDTSDHSPMGPRLDRARFATGRGGGMCRAHQCRCRPWVRDRRSPARAVTAGRLAVAGAPGGGEWNGDEAPTDEPRPPCARSFCGSGADSSGERWRDDLRAGRRGHGRGYHCDVQHSRHSPVYWRQGNLDHRRHGLGPRRSSMFGWRRWLRRG